MAWQIGIDEAGYGPNLGPFVMTLVACRVPDDLQHASLWDVLKAGTRRVGESADNRLIVADSKQVYSPANGWNDLEKTALAAHSGGFQSSPHAPREEVVTRSVTTTLNDLLRALAANDLPLLRREAWFQGDTALPTEIAADDLTASIDGWRNTSAAAGVAWGFCQSAIVAAPRFNDLIDKWDSKSAVLSVAVTQLMQQCLKNTAAEPMRFIIDKHGGRNAYSALFRH